MAPIVPTLRHERRLWNEGLVRVVGVERTFKIHSPRIEKIEVVRHGQVRRAQLYFLRKRVGKAATLRERRTNR